VKCGISDIPGIQGIRPMFSRSMTHLLLSTGIVLAALCGAGSSTAAAQDRDSAIGFQFPRNAASWVNSQPFTREQLAGKCAVMVFFEEG
jgi:ABC-type sugar transport system substrate-binding protein